MTAPATTEKGEKLQFGTWEIGGPRHYYRERLILKTLEGTLPSGKVVDVGCGTGSLVLKLARRGYHVLGVDLSDACIRVTRERVRNEGFSDRVEVNRGMAAGIGAPDGSFDAVIAGEVLEHLEDDVSAVKEFCRVLRPGGICLITVPANPDLWDPWDEMAGHLRRYRDSDLRNLFEPRGFEIEKTHHWGFPVMRFYHRLLCLPWARAVPMRKKLDGNNLDLVTRVGLNRWTSVALGTLFRLDDLFASFPWGIGVLLLARKR